MKIEREIMKNQHSAGLALIPLLFGLILVSSVAVCAKEPVQAAKPKVTFVELGSVNCIPCKAMKKVMDSLAIKYPMDLKIVFHDVWTEAGQPAAKLYHIRSIPTQVFLDAKGVEYHRHEGYLPMAEVEKVLTRKQVAK